ncbi:MAG: hypothetical protein R3C56_06385 [Pirellulaceae bacterium]
MKTAIASWSPLQVPALLPLNRYSGALHKAIMTVQAAIDQRSFKAPPSKPGVHSADSFQSGD